MATKNVIKPKVTVLNRSKHITSSAIKTLYKVSYQGKKSEYFPQWWVAMVFALYVFRHPHVMQQSELNANSTNI